MEVSAYDIASRFIGIEEVPGRKDNAQILSMLRLDQTWPESDEVPWCAAFTNYVAWLLRLPRSKSLLARSWLSVGLPIALEDAQVGFDVVILKRGAGSQPGPTNLTAPGHVGFFAGLERPYVLLLGGNQLDRVGINHYRTSRILGVRRLLWI